MTICHFLLENIDLDPEKLRTTEFSTEEARHTWNWDAICAVGLEKSKIEHNLRNS